MKNLDEHIIDIKSLFSRPVNRPFLISGPCSAETEEQVVKVARSFSDLNIPIDLFRAGIWKPRTRPNSFHGVGNIGLDWLVRVKKEFGYSVTTEVATAQHVDITLKKGIDVLWIGARTTVNPFSVQEIAEALKGVDIPILIKNPINPDLKLWIGAIERIHNAGIKKIGVIHRGFSKFGQSIYRNDPLWQIPIELMRAFPDLFIICDASHICGNRERLFEISQNALDLNYDGIMLESHCDPDNALSDPLQQLKPTNLKEDILSKLIRRQAKTSDAKFINMIDELRSQIDVIDSELILKLGARMALADEIGKYKKENNIAILQPERWNMIIKKSLSEANELGLSEEFILGLLRAIHQESIEHQKKIMRD